MKLIALSGSIRSKKAPSPSCITQWLTSPCTDFEGFIELLKQSDTSFLSNTDFMCLVALKSAALQGVEVQYINLGEIFAQKIPSPSMDPYLEHDLHFKLQQNESGVKALLQTILKAQGILLASPVYFGDRSSLMSSLLGVSGIQESLHQKLVAALSVGAKRNGGQETTNLFLLEKARELGAWVLGNGPPVSQYGGTAQAGDRQTILEDLWGLQTAWQTGARMAEGVLKLSCAKNQTSWSSLRMGILQVQSDARGIFDSRIEQRLKKLTSIFPAIEWKHFKLCQESIERCFACKVCPIPEKRIDEQAYACIIAEHGDAMAPLRSQIQSLDGIVLAGMNFHSHHEVVDRYQHFIERTRFIRRNDFEWSHLPVTSMLLEEPGARQNLLFHTKVMSAFLRHNTWVLSPLHEMEGFQNHTDFENRLHHQWEKWIKGVKHIALARANSTAEKVQYQAIGYQDKRLDHTQTSRL